MDYNGHVLSGLLTYPLAVLFASFLKQYAGIPFKMSLMATIFGYAVYVLGSDLPDLDHPEALVHRGIKPIVSVMVGSAVVAKIRDSIAFGNDTWMNGGISWAIGALFAVGAWYAFGAVIPKHRGVVHSLMFAGIYGLSIFALCRYGLIFGFKEALFVAFMAFLGYTLLLVGDKKVKLI